MYTFSRSPYPFFRPFEQVNILFEQFELKHLLNVQFYLFIVKILSLIIIYCKKFL